VTRGPFMMLAPARRALCRRCAWIAAALSLLLGAGSLPDETQGAAIAKGQPKTHTVTIEATSFKPESLTVAAGDKVVWVNKDPFPHTATSTSGGFDSGNIEPDKSWTFTAVKKGEFGYICSLHPTMKAVLKVE
jgi:plastocyanin